MAQASPEPATALETLAARVVQRRVGPCRLLMLPTPVRGVVTWCGSFASGPDFAAGDELLQVLAVRLLDKGTHTRDRFALADVLERSGAELDFSSEELRVGFEGRCLRDDLPDVLGVMVEQLREPLFEAEEFDKERLNYTAALQRLLESTGRQAQGALTRLIYDTGHPNFIPPPDETLARLDHLRPELLHAYHAQHFGSNDLVLVLVGDLDVDAVAAVVGEVFAGWEPHESAPSYTAATAPRVPTRRVIAVPDRNNVDVRLGQAVAVRRQDADYVPLYLANFIVGGNFSARLMTEVRNRQGLTYGIGSTLSGITTDHDGHWQVSVTLSRDRLDDGVAATLGEVRRFVLDGATDEELEEKKTTISGSFKVGLSTTGGLAGTLHRNAARGFDVDYLDRFLSEVEAVSLEDLHGVTRRHLDPENLHVAICGTLDDA